ncbi:DUF2065 domain-containing protein [Aeromonas caviae]|nr:DUF2065 domain-containing protein [Aeromonas caviae]
MGLGLLLLFEGLGPLLAPRAWQQMLRLLGELPQEQLRRIGGCLVVAGGVILWALAR